MMANGMSASRDVGKGVGMGTGMTPGGSTLAEGATVVLRRHAETPMSSSELRAGLRPLVRRARDGGSTIEQLLVTFKRAWAELPEVRVSLSERSETTRRLERVITLVIETYYEP